MKPASRGLAADHRGSRQPLPGAAHRLDGVEAQATYGGPGAELARLGGEVDLLIVGSRSYGPMHRMFLGTTSTYLTRHLGCPLLVLPRVAQPAAGVATAQASQAERDPDLPSPM